MTLEKSIQVTHESPSPVVSPVRIPDFRLLWLGATAVSLGVQFYSVALVWLVLHLTGSGLQLGTLLTIAAIPRAISMLMSGALIDRYPPRRILAISAFVNAALMSVVLLLLGSGSMSMVALFIIAPLNGLMDAVFYPTNTALIPRLVSKTQLAPANALMQTADTIANIAGPSLSGILIGEVGRLTASPEVGLIAGFAVITGLFFTGMIIFLSLSRRTDSIETSGDTSPSESLGKAVISGIRYAMHKAPIRISLLMIALLNFSAIGPIVVGGALLVERRFSGDATMYGIMMAAFGVGSLLGAFITTYLRLKRPGMALVYTAFALAAGLAALGFVPSFWMAFAVCFAIGIFVALTNINAITWLQLKTEMHMQGRIASLVVFAAVALDPFSNAISGALGEIDLPLLFCAAALLVGLGGLAALRNPALREEVAS
jgi:MFS family permease